MTDSARPRLVIHIGAGKTGSSTIQEVLAANRDRLAERGVIVPDTHLGLHGRNNGTQVTFFGALQPVTETGVSDVTRRLESLADAARRQPAMSVVISAENLMNREDFPDLFRHADRWFDVVVVIYIRRQDDFLMSRWAQWGLKINPDFRAWTARAVGRAGDWDRIMGTWQERLPTATLLPRIFDREVLVDGDVATDFLNALGVDPEGLVGVGDREVNQRLNEVALRIVSRNRRLFRDHNDNRFTDYLREFGAPLVFQSTPTGLMWTREERQQVMAAYAESNERVRARYFPERNEGDLFSSRFPDDDPVLPEREQLLAELDILWTAMFNQHLARGRMPFPLPRWASGVRPMIGRAERFARRRL